MVVRGCHDRGTHAQAQKTSMSTHGRAWPTHCSAINGMPMAVIGEDSPRAHSIEVAHDTVCRGTRHNVVGSLAWRSERACNAVMGRRQQRSMVGSAARHRGMVGRGGWWLVACQIGQTMTTSTGLCTAKRVCACAQRGLVIAPIQENSLSSYYARILKSSI